MKKNIWTYFINGFSVAFVVLGSWTMGATYKMYDNYNIANDEYDFFSSFSKELNNNPSSGPLSGGNLELLELIKIKYNVEITEFSMKQFNNFFKSRDKYIKYMSNKNSSFIFDKNRLNEITNNIKNNENIGNNIRAINVFLKNRYFSKNFEPKIKKYITNTFYCTYYYDSIPESISMYSGIALLFVGFSSIISYWIIYIYKNGKKNK